MQTAQPIVAGVDGSKASLRALREARHLADLMGCPLKVFTAWEWPATAAEYPYPVEYSFEEDAKLRLAESIAAVFGKELPSELEREVHGARRRPSCGTSVRTPGWWWWAAGATADSSACYWVRLVPPWLPRQVPCADHPLHH